MNSILILLALFSLTLVVSNLGIFSKTKAFSYIAVPLILGSLFAPDSLLPTLPSTRENLSWAIRVGLTWMTFLSATRITQRFKATDKGLKFALIFISYGLFFVVCLFLVSAPFVSDLLNRIAIPVAPMSMMAVALSLVLTSTLYSSRENPFLLVIFFLSLLFLFNGTAVSFGPLDLVFPLGIGFIMAVICRLIIPTRKPFTSSTRLTLLGLCTLGTGWAIGMGCMEVLVGLALGWTMAFTHKLGLTADGILKATENPVSYVVAFFAGLYIQLNPTVLVIGVGFALIRFFIKNLLLNTFPINRGSDDFISNNMPISSLALPIVVSLHLSPQQENITGFILSCFCVGFVTNDFIALVMEVLTTRRFKKRLAQ